MKKGVIRSMDFGKWLRKGGWSESYGCECMAKKHCLRKFIISILLVLSLMVNMIPTILPAVVQAEELTSMDKDSTANSQDTDVVEIPKVSEYKAPVENLKEKGYKVGSV